MLDEVEGGWTEQLRTKCRSDAYVSERQALEVLFADLKRLMKARVEFLKRPVEFPEAGLPPLKPAKQLHVESQMASPLG